MSRNGFKRIEDILREMQEHLSSPSGWKENLLFFGMKNSDYHGFGGGDILSGLTKHVC